MERHVFNDILRKHGEADIEKHLVYGYISRNGIGYARSPLLSAYLHGFEEDSLLAASVRRLDVRSLKELENCLELLIPGADRKINGAFFTPSYIVDFIIAETAPRAGDRNLDPSCGCGAFLMGLAAYYRKVHGKTVREALRENIFGADILPYNVRRAKLLLCLYALQEGEVLEEQDFNLSVQDSLKAGWDGEFDNVVGNPPYVKFQDLPAESRSQIGSHWETASKGAFNLYFAFFELGYKLLRTGGKLGYITPNNYFTSLAGEPLRRFFQRERCVRRIIDFGSQKVFEVQVYTALTFLQKSVQDVLLFDRIREHDSPEQYLPVAGGSPNGYAALNAKKWRLLKEEEQEIVRQIETAGVPIGRLFDICAGIATLKDEVFFVDTQAVSEGCYVKETVKGRFLIEKEVTRPVYKISDFKSQQDVAANRRRIICPYRATDSGKAEAIPEREFAAKYPKCYEYLLSEKDTLLSRDKGKVEYSPFYVWGRTQGLNRFGKKLLNPTFSQTPRFLRVDEEHSFFTNGYGLFCKEQPRQGGASLFAQEGNPLASAGNMDVLQKILNSSVMHYYVSKTSVAIEGGYPCYQKNFIERFSVPFLSDDEIDTVRRLESREAIDAFLCGKYHIRLPQPNLSR